jgi:quercetin dioxygenase-like cupin family protein
MNMPMVDKINNLEKYITNNFETIELPVEHFQIPGVYVRALYIAKGVVLTGKIHNFECINIVAKGSLCVTTNDDDKTIILREGMIFNSPAGTKRAGYALEDTIYVTVHRSDKLGISNIEKYLVSDTFDEYQAQLEVLS